MDHGSSRFAAPLAMDPRTRTSCTLASPRRLALRAHTLALLHLSAVYWIAHGFLDKQWMVCFASHSLALFCAPLCAWMVHNSHLPHADLHSRGSLRLHASALSFCTLWIALHVCTHSPRGLVLFMDGFCTHSHSTLDRFTHVLHALFSRLRFIVRCHS